MVALATQHKVIDTDTHIIEPYDLWQSRVSVKKWGDKVPHVRWDEKTQEEAWYFGDVRTMSAAGAAMAGWRDYPPKRPQKLEYVDKSLYEAPGRLKRMDECGIHAQVLYPNAAGFGAGRFLALADHNLMRECVQAYNNWVTEWASADPKRLHPMTALPFWDIPETIREMERCAKMGHKGIIMCSEPETFKLPKLTDPHWDPMWAAAQSMELSVNFHVGAGEMWYFDMMHERVGKHAAFASMGALFSLDLGAVVSQLTCGGICHAFPKLNFVLVESGVGWIPYLLASLDYQWLNCGAHKENPEYKLIPSEFFKRQIYGAFWFERETLKPAIDILGADSIFYETDFPHPTSMYPGPATSAINPKDYIEKAFEGVSAADTAKILHGNAARIYHID
jgi:predicted TIM-barrel fold metal-dependent hydrolase